MMRNKDGSLRVGVRFASHVVAATSVFAIVAIAAVALGYLLAWVRALGDDVVPAYVRRTLTMLEFGVFVVDVGGFVLYVVVESIGLVVLVVKAARNARVY